MPTSQPQPLKTLLTGATLITHLQHKAQLLIKINQTLYMLLPLPLRPWCRVANYRQGILILETSTASWNMRLRYEKERLLLAMRQTILPNLVTLEIKMNPTLLMNPLPGYTLGSEASSLLKRLISPQSAKHIRLLAAQCPTGLSKKLLELAAHENKKF